MRRKAVSTFETWPEAGPRVDLNICHTRRAINTRCSQGSAALTAANIQ